MAQAHCLKNAHINFIFPRVFFGFRVGNPQIDGWTDGKTHMRPVNCITGNNKKPLSVGWADRTAYIRRPAFDFRSRKEIYYIQSDCSPTIHALTTLLYWMLQSTLGNDTVIWCTWVMAATMHSKLRPNRCRERDMFTTDSHRNSSSPYSTVPSPTTITHRLATKPHDWHSKVCNDPSRSSKIDGFHGIWKGLCDFLLLTDSNLGYPVSQRFWDAATYRLKKAYFPPAHLCSTPYFKMFLLH